MLLLLGITAGIAVFAIMVADQFEERARAVQREQSIGWDA
jgi:hypothetical protein